MHWWPRQMPRSGTRPAKASTSAMETPASFGVQGPGESTMRSGASASTPATSISSLRRTTTSAPSSPRYCTTLKVKES